MPSQCGTPVVESDTGDMVDGQNSAAWTCGEHTGLEESLVVTHEVHRSRFGLCPGRWVEDDLRVVEHTRKCMRECVRTCRTCTCQLSGSHDPQARTTSQWHVLAVIPRRIADSAA